MYAFFCSFGFSPRSFSQKQHRYEGCAKYKLQVQTLEFLDLDQFSFFL